MSSNTRTATCNTATSTESPGFYERQVLQAFRQMKHGQLQLRLVDGSLCLLGNREDRCSHEEKQAPAALAIPQTAMISVRRVAFFEKCALYGDIGFAESYIDGDWETPDISAVIAWFLLNIDEAPTLSGSRAKALGVNVLRAANRFKHLLRPNSRRTAVQNISEHYDLSSDFFRLWLDPTMMYSSALWERSEFSLEQAQIAKNDALCKKLQLKPSDHVLEIGTGWGAWCLHAVRNYGCRVTTLTLSKSQYELARQRVIAAGLQDRIEVRLQDYRDLPVSEIYDKLVSIEMLEAVGHHYLEDWTRVAARALKRDGLMALQFITCPDARYDEFRKGVDFIQKHIFPGSLLLSLNRLNTLLSKSGDFVLLGLDDLGQHYARTLRTWREEFNRRASDVTELGFDHRFQRKWNYYLSYCEAAFAMRNISVVQTVHTRPNNLNFE